MRIVFPILRILPYVLAPLIFIFVIRQVGIGIPFIGESEEERRAPEREILVAFYNATGGAEWENNDLWLSERPVESWYGVDYDIFGDGVEAIELESNGLKGQIPSDQPWPRPRSFLSQDLRN